MFNEAADSRPWWLPSLLQQDGRVGELVMNDSWIRGERQGNKQQDERCSRTCQRPSFCFFCCPLSVWQYLINPHGRARCCISCTSLYFQHSGGGRCYLNSNLSEFRRPSTGLRMGSPLFCAVCFLSFAVLSCSVSGCTLCVLHRSKF